MRRLIRAVLTLGIAVAVSACSAADPVAAPNTSSSSGAVTSSGTSGATSGSSSTASSTAASSTQLSTTSSTDAPDGSVDDGSVDESGQDRFPCYLIEADDPADFVRDPAFDAENTDDIRNDGCSWNSGADDGDSLVLNWEAPAFSAARATGRTIPDLGDEAFYDQVNTNVGSSMDRLVIQTRLFVGIGDDNFLLVLRTEDPDVDALAELAAAIVDRCGSGGGCRPAETSTGPTVDTVDSACALLTADEISAVVGDVLTGRIVGSTDQGCTWDSATGSGPDDFALFEQDAEYWEEFQGFDVEAVAGVGDGACYRFGQLFFTQGGAYWLVVNGTANAASENLAQLTELAQLVSTRI